LEDLWSIVDGASACTSSPHFDGLLYFRTYFRFVNVKLDSFPRQQIHKTPIHLSMSFLFLPGFEQLDHLDDARRFGVGCRSSAYLTFSFD